MIQMTLKALSVRAGLGLYERQARDLIRAYRARDPEALRCIRQHHPRLPGRANTNDRNSVTHSEIRKAKVTLADAQTIVARWHGFAGWLNLKKHIEALANKESCVLKFELAVEAVTRGDLATLKLLIGNHPELIRARSTREHQATLLHYVSANGVEGYRQKTPGNAVKIAEMLIKAGAEVDADLDYGLAGRRLYPERTGSTTLGLVATSVHPAVAGVQIGLLKVLLKAGADVNGIPGGWNPVIAALHNGRGDAAMFLANRGARLDLEGAAGTGRLDALAQFIDRRGKLIRGATQEQLNYGFIWACEYGHVKVVRFLIGRKFEPDWDFMHGQTGLHWAAYGGHTEVVDLLLKTNAPVNVMDRIHGGTPLGWAVYGWNNPAPEFQNARYAEVVERLVHAGAVVDWQWIGSPNRRSSLGEQLRKDRRMMAALRLKE
ncbi:MAG: hypothetical protein C5B50_18735 [Verrucomicrobia bacterium]|nr:MAG: hypothetical protein C5B50_18735 [Verrucomicrobiota bacterium]